MSRASAGGYVMDAAFTPQAREDRLRAARQGVVTGGGISTMAGTTRPGTAVRRPMSQLGMLGRPAVGLSTPGMPFSGTPRPGFSSHTSSPRLPERPTRPQSAASGAGVAGLRARAVVPPQPASPMSRPAGHAGHHLMSPRAPPPNSNTLLGYGQMPSELFGHADIRSELEAGRRAIDAANAASRRSNASSFGRTAGPTSSRQSGASTTPQTDASRMPSSGFEGSRPPSPVQHPNEISFGSPAVVPVGKNEPAAPATIRASPPPPPPAAVTTPSPPTTAQSASSRRSGQSRSSRSSSGMDQPDSADHSNDQSAVPSHAAPASRASLPSSADQHRREHSSQQHAMPTGAQPAAGPTSHPMQASHASQATSRHGGSQGGSSGQGGGLPNSQAGVRFEQSGTPPDAPAAASVVRTSPAQQQQQYSGIVSSVPGVSNGGGGGARGSSASHHPLHGLPVAPNPRQGGSTSAQATPQQALQGLRMQGQTNARPQQERVAVAAAATRPGNHQPIVRKSSAAPKTGEIRRGVSSARQNEIISDDEDEDEEIPLNLSSDDDDDEEEEEEPLPPAAAVPRDFERAGVGPRADSGFAAIQSVSSRGLSPCPSADSFNGGGGEQQQHLNTVDDAGGREDQLAATGSVRRRLSPSPEDDPETWSPVVVTAPVTGYTTLLLNEKCSRITANGAGADALQASLATHGSITSLDLKHHSIRLTSRSLEDIGRVLLVGPTTARQPGRGLNNSSPHSSISNRVVHLDLTNCCLTDSCFPAMQVLLGGDSSSGGDAKSKPASSITSLNLQGNCVRDRVAGAISLCIVNGSCSLDTLNLNGNSVGVDGVRSIALAAARPNCSLTDLDLSSTGITHGDGSAEHIATMLSSALQLRSLSLAWNRLSDAGTIALAEGLERAQLKGPGGGGGMPQLAVLNLNHNCVGSTGAQAIAQVLSSSTSTSLTELNCQNNSMGDAGAASLATMLSRNRCLRKLDVRQNDISTDGGVMLLGSFKNNRTLTALDFYGNPICSDTVELLDSVLLDRAAMPSTSTLLQGSSPTNPSPSRPASGGATAGGAVSIDPASSSSLDLDASGVYLGGTVGLSPTAPLSSRPGTARTRPGTAQQRSGDVSFRGSVSLPQGQYQGQLNTANQPHGKGKIEFNSEAGGGWYDGEWANGVMHGEHGCVRVFRDGSQFSGGWRDGVRCCEEGCLRSATGEMLHAPFSKDVPSGFGSVTSADGGSVWRGRWEGGQRHGWGCTKAGWEVTYHKYEQGAVAGCMLPMAAASALKTLGGHSRGGHTKTDLSLTSGGGAPADLDATMSREGVGICLLVLRTEQNSASGGGSSSSSTDLCSNAAVALGRLCTKQCDYDLVDAECGIQSLLRLLGSVSGASGAGAGTGGAIGGSALSKKKPALRPSSAVPTRSNTGQPLGRLSAAALARPGSAMPSNHVQQPQPQPSAEEVQLSLDVTSAVVYALSRITVGHQPSRANLLASDTGVRLLVGALRCPQRDAATNAARVVSNLALEGSGRHNGDLMREGIVAPLIALLQACNEDWFLANIGGHGGAAAAATATVGGSADTVSTIDSSSVTAATAQSNRQPFNLDGSTCALLEAVLLSCRRLCQDEVSASRFLKESAAPTLIQMFKGIQEQHNDGGVMPQSSHRLITSALAVLCQIASTCSETDRQKLIKAGAIQPIMDGLGSLFESFQTIARDCSDSAAAGDESPTSGGGGTGFTSLHTGLNSDLTSVLEGLQHALGGLSALVRGNQSAVEALLSRESCRSLHPLTCLLVPLAHLQANHINAKDSHGCVNDSAAWQASDGSPNASFVLNTSGVDLNASFASYASVPGDAPLPLDSSNLTTSQSLPVEVSISRYIAQLARDLLMLLTQCGTAQHKSSEDDNTSATSSVILCGPCLDVPSDVWAGQGASKAMVTDEVDEFAFDDSEQWKKASALAAEKAADAVSAVAGPKVGGDAKQVKEGEEDEEDEVLELPPPNFSNLWGSKLFADLTFNVDGRRLSCHKVVVCSGSAYFETMLAGHGFLECLEQAGSAAESSNSSMPSKEVRIHDVEYGVFLQVLEYLYCGEVSVIPSIALELLQCAHEYMLPGLTALCERTLLAEVDASNAVVLVSAADLYELPCLRQCCLRTLKLSLCDILQADESQEDDDVEAGPAYVQLAGLGAEVVEEIVRIQRDEAPLKLPPLNLKSTYRSNVGSYLDCFEDSTFGELSDVTIWVDGGSGGGSGAAGFAESDFYGSSKSNNGSGRSQSWVPIRAHKAVLASQSRYFHDMLGPGKPHDGVKDITLRDASYAGMKALLSCMYTHQLCSDPDVLPDLHKAAITFMIPAMVQQTKEGLEAVASRKKALATADEDERLRVIAEEANLLPFDSDEEAEIQANMAAAAALAAAGATN